MTPYQLNMARDFVMPLESRKKWLRWFFAYLAVCCVMIAWVLQDLIQGANRAKSRLEALRQQEARFLAGYPEFKSIQEYKAAIGGSVSTAVREVESVVSFEKNEFRMAGILLGLVEPLPPGMELGSLDIDAELQKVVFEVVMPSALKLDERMSPPQLVAMWEKEPRLAGHLVQIESENSERMKRNGMEMLCWRFSAVAGGR